MNKYVILFRGINVGGNNKLPMTALKQILNSLDCNDIQTYIQSGNVVFTHSKKNLDQLTEKIKGKINLEHGFAPEIFIYSSNSFLKFIKDSPFQSKTGKDLHFFFLKAPPKKPDIKKLELVKTPTEQFNTSKNVFYLLAPDGIGRSKLVPQIEKAMNVPVTGRNFNTVEKIKSLLND